MIHFKQIKQFILLLVLALFSTSGAWAVEYNLATLTSNDRKSTGNITLTYTSAAATDADYTGNQLAGVDAATTISSSDYADKVIYTLAKQDDDFGSTDGDY